jgi:hypothetical protein
VETTVIDKTYTPIKLNFAGFNPGAVTASQAGEIPNVVDPTKTADMQVGFLLGAYCAISAAGGFPAKVKVFAFDGDPEGVAGSFNLIYEVEFEFSANDTTLSDLLPGVVVTFRRGCYLRCSTDQAGTTVAVSPVFGTGEILAFTG